jgi:hypothetical protein
MRGRGSQLWGDNRRLGLAPWAKPNLRPNPVSQFFICVCLSTPIPPGFFLAHSVKDEIAEMKGYNRLG